MVAFGVGNAWSLFPRDGCSGNLPLGQRIGDEEVLMEDVLGRLWMFCPGRGGGGKRKRHFAG